MTKADAIRQLAARETAFRGFGVKGLHLFGSTAVDRARPGSDLDLFVDPTPGRKFSLFDMVGIKLLVENELNVEVDVTTRSGLHPLLKGEIERGAIRIF